MLNPTGHRETDKGSRHIETIEITAMNPQEEGLLSEFFYHAIFLPPGSNPYPENIIERPELLKYFAQWGRQGDFAFVARVKGQARGMVWIRFFSELNKSYGYVAEDIPELSMSVLPEHRDHGIGSRLLTDMIDYCRDKGYRGISLSVDQRNRAVALYKRFGFTVSKSPGTDYVMILNLQNNGEKKQ